MDQAHKEKYEQYKLTVKKWEYNFRKENKRIPSKYDIRDAPYNVKQAYKMYYRMKTTILSQTLTDVLDDDEEDYQNSTQPSSEDFLDISQLSTSHAVNITVSDSIQELLDPSKELPTVRTAPQLHASPTIRDYEAADQQSAVNSDNVWNQKLHKVSKVDAPAAVNKSKESPARKTLWQRGLSFDKSDPRIYSIRDVRQRAPRECSKPVNGVQIVSGRILDDSIPDLETLLLEKSRRERAIKKPEAPAADADIKTAVDIDWLDRNAPTNDASHVSKKDGESVAPEATPKFGISNLKVPAQVEQTPTPVDESKFIEAKYHSGNVSDDEYVESQMVSKEEILPISKKRRLSHEASTNELDVPSSTNLPTINEQPGPDEQRPVKQVPPKPKRKTIQKANDALRDQTRSNVHNYDTDDDDGGDDSDKDPNFEQKEPVEKSPSPVMLKRKRSLIKRSKEGITKATKKAAKILTRNKRNYKVNQNEIDADQTKDEEEKKEEEENINFFIDTEIGHIKCVPRASEKDITNSEKLFDNFVQQSTVQDPTSEARKIVDFKTAAKKEALQKKIAAGTLNDNFVRINMKKKVFVRGKKAFNFSRYKKTLWKSKKKAASVLDDMRGCDGGVVKCFNCDGVGHFASQCKKKEDNLLPIEATVEESTLPTLQEAAQMASDQKMLAHASKPHSIPSTSNEIWKDTSESMEIDSADSEVHEKENASLNCAPTPVFKKSYIGHAIPEDFLQKSGLLEMNTLKDEEIKPYLPLNADGSVPEEVPKEVLKALQQFGHKSFRPGQESAIMRILCGRSTLVTLSTGSGKSLCYQLPAYMYRQKSHCITLVISPLVSLMEDQVYGIPDFINAQCLHTNQTPKQREKVMNEIKHGRVEILLVSPEAVVSSEKSTGFGAILRQLPPIAFACIDEAHCVSQWSHNFRPSYLMICRVLRDKLGVKTVLGLTATATLQTRNNIVNHLAIPDGCDGIISDIPLPDNLVLTLSRDENRDRALLELLRSERFVSLQSVIIYCTRRDECERIAGYLRTCLQDNTRKEEAAPTSSKKRKRTIWYAEAYHAGMVASRRRTIQNAFMSGELRIVVATVAFGMGINLSSIRGIIHYNMPKSFENYVQEVGRAGRDGKIAHCHVFLNSKGEDLSELRRHIYANSIDRHVIRKLLQKIFIPCSCKIRLRENEAAEIVPKTQRVCPGHEVCFSVEQTVQSLDIPEENIATLLCYLELHEERFVKVLGNAYTTCKIVSYSGPAYMKQMAKSCPPLAMAIALELKNGKKPEDLGSIEFCVIDVASAIGWDSGVVKYQLKQLEWTKANGSNKRSPLTISFSDVGFRIRAPGDLSDEELDKALDSLEMRTRSQERAQLVQLQTIFDSFMSLAFPSIAKCTSNDLSIHESNELKVIIRKYFQSNLPLDIEISDEVDNTPDEEIIGSIHKIVSMYPENNFSGRSLSRIFHGISSPCFPAVIWGRCKFWRAHLSVNFNRLVRLGNREIVRMRLH